MTTFASLDLCPELQTTLQQLGYEKPTPIQAKAIPLVLQGRDLLAEAQTGTGKTASFSLPLIEQLQRSPNTQEPRPVRVLVLAPTRELTQQVAEMMQRYGRALGMRAIAVFGGVRLENQCRKLERGVDILVATPGRLLELLDKNTSIWISCSIWFWMRRTGCSIWVSQTLCNALCAMCLNSVRLCCFLRRLMKRLKHWPAIT